MLKYETLAQDYKRAGRFDTLRKQLLLQFTESPSGQKLLEKLRKVCAESNQSQLISILSQDSHYTEAEKELNVYFLGTASMRERIKNELYQVWEQKYSDSSAINSTHAASQGHSQTPSGNLESESEQPDRITKRPRIE